MRILLACTCLTPIALGAAASPALAELVIATARTTPVATATAGANGGSDDVRITSAGSVRLANGVAVTVNSSENAANEGTIEIRNANDAVGILAQPGLAGTITNGGTITIDETYEPADANNDRDLDGPLAQGARRYGIRVAPGGIFTGNIVNSGTILVEGNQSAGIAVDSALAGSLTSSGRVNVVGDESTAIRAGDVSGNVTLRGTVGAQGRAAVGAAFDGDIGGALVVQAAVSATGYRYGAAPGRPEDLDADDLLQGGPALRISGNVAGGILLDTAPADNSATDTDEDKDGVPDAQEGNAAVTSAGASPAMLIGSATEDLTIGAVAGQGQGLVIKGSVAGSGVFTGVDGNGLVIGGLGGDVSIAGGMRIAGGVGAASNGANATALRIGSGATVPQMTVSGTVSASGGKAADTRAVAIQLDSGSAMTTLTNSGTIRATSTEKASATAIRDLSGELDAITNSGDILASVTSPDSTASGVATAIDLRANTSGVVIRQAGLVDADTPSIEGDILTGSGNDVIEVSKGTIRGNMRLGAGNDMVALSGASSFTGTADFGGDAGQLSLGGTSRFTGQLLNGANVGVTVNGGTLALNNAGDVAMGSLNVAGQGTIGVNINGAANTHTRYVVAGGASFAAGSKVSVNFSNIGDSEGNYVIVDAGTLTGGANLVATTADLPFLYKSTLSANQAAGEITLSVARKSNGELGLNRAQGQAIDAIYGVLDEDERMADIFLSIRDADAFGAAVRQMMPNHAGGVFETVTQGSRATARFLADPDFVFAEQGRVGFWLQQVAWGTSKDLGDAAAYDISGWGATGGADVEVGSLGRVGFSLGYLAGKDADGDTENEVNTSQYELALHWRGDWGGAQAFARVSAAHIGFEGTRFFMASDGQGDVRRENHGDWNGKLYSAAGGIAYELGMGRLSLRPAVSIDYYRLSEDGYTETGGGEAFDLVVEKRKSDEAAVNATLNLGYDLGATSGEGGRLRVEVEGGRRQIVGGEIGQTRAHFAGGDMFSIDPEARTDGWLGRLRLIGGLPGFLLGGEVGAEEQQGRAAVSARASLRVGF